MQALTKERTVQTMRDRLIELLEEKLNFEFLSHQIEALADYLLANGVIVPPCKVGDTVWIIYTDTNWRLEIVGHRILRGEIKAIEINESDGICFETKCSTFFPEHIGKTVFLTKEEAEKALKEREQSGQ